MNLRRIFYLLFILVNCATQVAGQQDPILFTIENEPVHVSEFTYIYTKTNGQKADFSLPSLTEYLDLYKKFKLKVHRAREMRLDTLSSLKQELAGYRKQLANNYLIDKEVTNLLIEEAYVRTQQDVNFSHILVKLEQNAAPEDTIKAWKKINEAWNSLSSQPFETVVAGFSEDESTIGKGGELGFFSALFPAGFYELENAAYQTKPGTYSKPFRTKLGYHIVKVNALRPARGEMECAHILIRKNPQLEKDPAKTRIDSIYTALKAGADFGAMARALSEDRMSAPKDGNIGVFGINRYEKSFEDAAFGLEKDGDISKPVETTAGWHIIQRIKGHTSEDPEIAKRRLEPKVKRDDRFELARISMIEKIKSNIGVVIEQATLDRYASRQTDSLFTYAWRPGAPDANAKIMSLGKNKSLTIADFETFLQKNSGKRVNISRANNNEASVKLLFDEFVKEECIKYEEDRLEEKYPDFKGLMREYEEGILLFEATKRTVWDRAGQDTLGLQEFFNKEVSHKYQWGERARVTFYLVQTQDAKFLEEVRKTASSKSPDVVLKRYNKPGEPIITTREFVYEHGKNTAVDQMVWKPGALSYNEEDKRTGGWSFLKIEEVIPPTPKTLDESRGYVIADYQDKLEKEWVAELASVYKIKVNQGEFQKLIRK